MKNILCTICARGNSKGLKNKNLKRIKNKPLIHFTIDHAIKSKIFNKIVVCSDSFRILNYSKRIKEIDTLKRPVKLARDDTPKIPVIRYSLIEMEKKYNKKFDIIIDLDVTAPLRKVSDIINALKQFKKKNNQTLFSACVSRRNPYFNAVEIKNRRPKPVKNLMKKIPGRQFAPKVFDMNASIYIWQRKTLLKSNTLFTKNTSIYVMPDERSLDIDNNFDFKIVKQLL